MVVNLTALLLFGKYLLRSVLFPFSNYFIREKIESQINRRYALEFAKMMVMLHRVVRIFAGQVPIEAFYLKEQINDGKKKSRKAEEEAKEEQEERNMLMKALSESKNETERRDRKKIIVDINQSKQSLCSFSFILFLEMFTAVELFNLYSKIN